VEGINRKVGVSLTKQLGQTPFVERLIMNASLGSSVHKKRVMPIQRRAIHGSGVPVSLSPRPRLTRADAASS
jgi:hypothetical protein